MVAISWRVHPTLQVKWHSHSFSNLLPQYRDIHQCTILVMNETDLNEIHFVMDGIYIILVRCLEVKKIDEIRFFGNMYDVSLLLCCASLVINIDTFCHIGRY